jgi:cbb3-type cytochrome oxidase subunit 3
MRLKIISFFIILSATFIFNIGAVLAVDDPSYGLDNTMAQGSLKGALRYNDVGSNPGGFLSTQSGRIVGSILAFIGVIFFLLIIFAGLTWMLSQGNQQKVEKAKDLMIAAVIGLIIVLAAYSITAFIGRQLTT